MHKPNAMLNQAVKNSAFTSMGTVSNLVLGMVFAGITIRYLGTARAGYFIALQAILGVNTVLGGQIFRGPGIQRIAAAAARGDWEECRRVVGTVSATNGIIGGVFALSLIISIPVLFRWSRLDASFGSEAAWATVFTAFTFFLDQVGGGLRMVYDARQRFDIVSGMSAIFGLLGNGARFAVLLKWPSMASVAAAGCMISLVWLSADVIVVRALLKQWVGVTWSFAILRPMLRFGGWNWAANLAGFLYGNLDRIILTSFLGSASLPYYALPLRIATQIYTALAGQAYMLFPMLAAAGEKAQQETSRLEGRLRWITGMVSMFAYVGLGLIGPTILSWLVSPQFAERAKWPLYLSCMVYFAWTQTLIYVFALWSIAKPASIVITDFGSNALSLLTALLLIPRFGYIGASIASMWRLPFVLIQLLWARRILKIRTGFWDAASAYVSTGCAMVVWVALVLALVSKVPTVSIWRVVVAVLGIVPSVAVIWYIETRFYPEKLRWSSMIRAFTLVWLKKASFATALKSRLKILLLKCQHAKQLRNSS